MTAWKPRRDVSWKRGVLAFAATMLSLFALAFVLSASRSPPSIIWLFYFVVLSNAIMWGVMFYSGKRESRAPSQDRSKAS